jgi:hypothetical protein
MVLTLAVGCLPAVPLHNEPPIAYIDLVSPASVAPGETVTLTGHGIDPDGSIAAYNWRSSLDGDLSTSASFKTSSLSQGTHTIWFKVQDDKGEWAKQVLATVIVIPSGAVKPVVNSFEASPGIINPGGSSTLSWNVSGAATVSIDQGIGNVALSGTRVVLPTKATTYTLTATNEFGSVTVTAQVVVTAVPLHTVELFSIGAEDGHVRRDGYVGQEVMVGYTVEKVGIQGFLSFDISALPKDATITSVSLDLDPGAAYVYGSPFERMGQLYICKNQYGKLNSDDYFVGPVTDFRSYGPGTPVICSLTRWPSNCSSSSLTVAAVQEQVDAGSDRFQVRLQFERDPYWEPYGTRWSEQWAAREANYLSFGSANPKLVIQYQY